LKGFLNSIVTRFISTFFAFERLFKLDSDTIHQYILAFDIFNVN